MTYLLCRNRVDDFAQWKRVFDSHADAQRKSGLQVQWVRQDIDDPNDILFLFEVDDLDKARAFISSPKVPGAQEASGMIEPPQMWFIK